MLTGEQTTALSNVVLASVCGALAWRARELWLSSAFASACVAASAGAVFHGFRHTAPAALLFGVWKLVLVGLAASSALLVVATLRRAMVPPWTERLVYVLALGKLAATLALATRSNGVAAAGADFVLTLVTVAALEWRRLSRAPEARWSLAAVALTLLALVLQASGFRHGQPFCHNDAFHLLQAGAFALFFLGLRSKVARSSAAPAPQAP